MFPYFPVCPYGTVEEGDICVMFPEYVSNIEDDHITFCKQLFFLEPGVIGVPQSPYDTDLVYYAALNSE